MSQAQQQSSSQTTDDAVDLEEIIAGYQSEVDADSNFLREVLRVVDSRIGAKYLREMRSEFARANVLANRNEAEVHEAKCLIRFRTNQFIMEHPPEGSKMTGSFRMLVYGDQNEPLSKAEVREIQAIENILIARVTQSRGMEQQKIIKEMRQDQHVSREDKSNERSGVLGSLFR